MGLVKALQGAPQSFSGYTNALGKKEERDFMSAQAEVAHKRAMSMQDLRIAHEKTQQTERLTAQQDENKLNRSHDFGLQEVKQSDAMAVSQQNFTNSLKLVEEKIRLEDLSEDNKRTQRMAAYTESGMDKALLEMGLSEGNEKIIAYSVAQGDKVAPLIAEMSKSMSAGSWTPKEKAEQYAKLLKEVNTTYVDMDGDQKEELIKKYNKEQPGVPTAQALANDMFMQLTGKDPAVRANKLDVLNQSQIKSTAAKFAGKTAKEIEADMAGEVSPESIKAIVKEVTKGATGGSATSGGVQFGATDQWNSFKEALSGPGATTDGWDDEN